MIDNSDERRLKIPIEIASDPAGTELISVWFSHGKVQIMTRSGTGLDTNSTIWGEILVGIATNIAACTRQETGSEEAVTLAAIKCTLDDGWPKA